MIDVGRILGLLAALGLATGCRDDSSDGPRGGSGNEGNTLSGSETGGVTGGAGGERSGESGGAGAQTGGRSSGGGEATGGSGAQSGAVTLGGGGAQGGAVTLGGGGAQGGHAELGGAEGGVGPTPTGGLPPVTPADVSYVPGSVVVKAPLITGSTSEVAYSAQVPSYELPLDASEIVNLQTEVATSSLFDWTPEAEALLASRGIVLLRGQNNLRRFDLAYGQLEATEAPILVTTDSTLHLYHLFFDQVLKSLELDELLPVYEVLLPAVVEKLRGLSAALEGDGAEAARRGTAALSVAAKLMFPDTFSVPPEVAPEVAAVITLVEQASGFELEPIFNRDCVFDVACGGDDVSPQDYEAGAACFCEDYSQYKPRGHYTEHEALERYFRGAMYLGRITLRVKSPMETRMAALLTSAMASTSVTFRDADVPAMELWDRIRRVTGFFVGAPDDLTFVEYDRVLREVYGEEFELTALDDGARLEILRDRLREEREPQIQSGMVQWHLDLTEQTQGLRFLGQSFAFDSYTLGQLVFDHVGPNVAHDDYQTVVDYPDAAVSAYCTRPDGVTGAFASCEGQTEADWAWLCCKARAIAELEGRPELLELCRLLPKGLDVAAAFGSSRAEQHLEPDLGHCSYPEQLASLQAETAAFTEEDHWRTLYDGWLHSLHPLFERDYAGLPTWMGGDAYRDKALQTGLASWAELRHDTILYVKQSYTSGIGGSSAIPPVEVNPYYVEPQPEVYSRLADLTRLTRAGLRELEMLATDLDTPITRLETLLGRLTSISVAELEHEVIDESDQEYISHIGTTFGNIILSIAAATSSVPEPPDPSIPSTLVRSVEGDPYKTTVVADVHTDGNTRRVLEVGSGYVDWAVVVNLDPTGALVANIGPVFSYYEFPHPMDDRLDDEAWQALLDGPDAPSRPAFVRDLYVP